MKRVLFFLTALNFWMFAQSDIMQFKAGNNTAVAGIGSGLWFKNGGGFVGLQHKPIRFIYADSIYISNIIFEADVSALVSLSHADIRNLGSEYKRVDYGFFKNGVFNDLQTKNVVITGESEVRIKSNNSIQPVFVGTPAQKVKAGFFDYIEADDIRGVNFTNDVILFPFYAGAAFYTPGVSDSAEFTISYDAGNDENYIGLNSTAASGDLQTSSVYLKLSLPAGNNKFHDDFLNIDFATLTLDTLENYVKLSIYDGATLRYESDKLASAISGQFETYTIAKTDGTISTFDINDVLTLIIEYGSILDPTPKWARTAKIFINFD